MAKCVVVMGSAVVVIVAATGITMGAFVSAVITSVNCKLLAVYVCVCMTKIRCTILSPHVQRHIIHASPSK